MSNLTMTPQHSPVKAKSRGRKGRELERRWTTGLEKGQLNLARNMTATDNAVLATSPQMSSNLQSNFSLASWSSTASDLDVNDPMVPTHIMNTLRTPTPISGSSSQPDVPQEIGKQYLSEKANNHQYQLSYELAVDSSPLSPSTYVPNSQESVYRNHIVKEIISTEKQFVKDLTDIIEGYYLPMQAKVEKESMQVKNGSLPITVQDITDLFGNIRQILSIHQSLLEDLEQNEGDYEKMGECFISRAEDFKSYTEYCNNYPKSIETFSKLVSEQGIPWFMKSCQQRLSHLLPLGAYLLKPVQRILKYSLLLKDLHRHMKRSTSGFTEIMNAKIKMTEVADHINEMKRKYDRIVRVQELQSLLHGWEGKDLIKYDDIVLENNLRVAYSKNGHTKLPSSVLKSTTKEMNVILFRKMLLITKRKEEGYQYKHHVEMKDIQLSENLKENNLLFQVRQISTKATLTFQARTPEIKSEWSDQIKELLLESIPHLPDKAKLLILQGFTTDIHKASKTTIESSKTMPRDISSRPVLTSLSKMGSSSPKQSRSWLKGKPTPPAAANQPKSFVEAGLFLSGYGVANASPPQNTKKQPMVSHGKSLETEPVNSNEDIKKSRRLRFGSLPNPVSSPNLRKSDSDPNIPEEDSRPSSRDSKANSPYGVNSEVNNSQCNSTSPNQLSVTGGVRNSVSSPDLKHVSEMLEAEEEEREDQQILSDDDTKQDSIQDLGLIGDMNRPLTPLSPANDSEVSFNITDDNDQAYSLPLHMRSKSAPVDVGSLETIPSNDNTPRGSFVKDEDQGLSMSPYMMRTEDDVEVSISPLLLIQSEQKSNSDDVIHIKSSLEYSKSFQDQDDDGSIVIANGGSPILQVESEYPANNRDAKMELMLFKELMSNGSNSQNISLHSQEVPEFSHDEKNDDRSHEMEFAVSPISPISPISIPEIKVDLATCGERRTMTRNNTSTSSIEENLVSPTSIRYSKQTTPYTSIEDLPSESEKCDDNEQFVTFQDKRLPLCDLSTQLALATTSDTPTDASTSVKRWHSLRTQRPGESIAQKQINARQNSQPNNSRNSEWSSFLRRNHSFKDSRPITNTRPISMVALVHSTRDNSDLVDLKDVIDRQREARNISDTVDETAPILKGLMNVRSGPELPSDLSGLHSELMEDESQLQKTYVESDPVDTDDHERPTKRESTVSMDSEKSFKTRRNRWSLKRTFNRSKRKMSNQESTSDEDKESKCSSMSEISISDVPLTPPPGGNDSAFFPSFSGSPEDKEILTIDGTDCTNNSLDVRPTRRNSKVQSLARDYSMRIKEKHSASCSPVQEERGSQPSITDESNNTSPAPIWYKQLNERRRRTNTVSGNRLIRNNSYALSMSQPTSPEPRSPNSLRSASLTPTTTGVLTPSSTDTTGTFNFDDRLPSSPSLSVNVFSSGSGGGADVTQHSNSSGLKSYSSESALTRSHDSVLDKPVLQSKKKKPGWVRYLVSKFNSNK